MTVRLREEIAMKKCEACGSKFSEDYAFCPECGGNLVEDVQEQDSNTEKVLKCEACGAEYTDDYAFCPECGGTLAECEKKKETVSMLVCDQCGSKFTGDYNFCPECGGSLTRKEVEKTAEDNLKKEDIAAPSSNQTTSGVAAAVPAANKKPKGKMAKTIGFAVGIVVLLIILLFACVNGTTRALTINDGETLKMDLGSRIELDDIDITGEELTESDLESAVWTPEYENIVRVKNGKIKATADPDYLIENDDGSLSDTESITVSIDTDNGSWEGTLEVEVTADPCYFENKELIQEPSGSRGSTVTIEPSKHCNMIIYMKSKSDSDNNMAFYVEKKAEKFDVSVPMNDYEVYVAAGDTWYGNNGRFGRFGDYHKYSEDLNFAAYTYTLTLSDMGKPDTITTWQDMTFLDWYEFPAIDE